jgi:N-acetylmuramoyl-L-alanine amidase
MGVLRHRARGRGCGWVGAVAWVGLCCVGSAAMRPERMGPWDAAVEARVRFEAEPAGTHTKVEYGQVMDGFRAIYHADPGDAHAARAVEQVAELLAEQGRELGDKKSLRDAAGQYEFLAKAYPGGTMAAHALEQAVMLLGPEAADDPVEAKKVRAQMELVYPKYAREMKAGDVVSRDVRPVEEKRSETVAGAGGERSFATANDVHPNDGEAVVRVGHPEAATDAAPVAREEPVKAVIPEAAEKVPVGPAAVVTGIRHWSTASYTRVAIDLQVEGDQDVKYEAARVEHPDRIFFDLHHAKLAPQLAGKSFNVTDDGFLTRVRAAQFNDEVTRVVLDVHQVAEYSAFLLPNPYRLIIDIHGKQGPENREDLAADRVAAGEGGRGVSEVAGVVPAPVGLVPAPVEAVPQAPAQSRDAGRASGSGVEVSSLPPMPVTDGSAGFGLPAKSEREVKVAAPRVVISTKPTVAKPVPNSVTRSSTETGTEVAAVSSQPGKIEATMRPTSKPIASGSRDDGASGDHYVPRSKRAAARAAGDDTSLTAADSRDVARVGADGTTHLSANKAAAKVGHTAAEPVEAAPPTADGDRSLMRALGLKIGRIVIDAGHGGHDSGTLGAGGIEEKDVVLDVALRLGKLLHDRLGAEIVYTRADDTFIPLETRTAIANKAQADLFISVHANSSVDTTARGVEVYYLNFTSDPEAMTVASRENAVSTQSVHELSDLVKKIALKDKIEESKELATDVDASLYAGLKRGNEGLKDRGVKKAPFVVLIGANMPSILAEISFVTNPDDAAQLETPAYRERVAESLYKGVAKYAAGINGARPKVRTTEEAAAE